jgi:GTPase involved in cell partitioning and DNA repair
MRSFSHGELEHLTNYWCKTLGIKAEDLTRHPQIDDVILLIKFIQEYEKELTPKQRVYVYIMWDWCYKKYNPLSKKYLKALTKIIHRLQQVRNLKATASKKARQKIKALYQHT